MIRVARKLNGLIIEKYDKQDSLESIKCLNLSLEISILQGSRAAQIRRVLLSIKRCKLGPKTKNITITVSNHNYFIEFFLLSIRVAYANVKVSKALCSLRLIFSTYLNWIDYIEIIAKFGVG